MGDLHVPVLLAEAVNRLLTKTDGVYVDGTAGMGGHSEAIAERLTGKGCLYCFDRDPEAVVLARERLRRFGDRVSVRDGNFSSLQGLMGERGLTEVDGVLLDLGLSSYQLERSGRGFSFLREEPLDMRMDFGRGVPAAELLAGLSLSELEKILKEFGEEKRARAISRAILKAGGRRPILTSDQLAHTVVSAYPPRMRAGFRHPATKTFQALRIAVNQELSALKGFLKDAPALIAGGGRVVVLSYHSLEDRLVKQAMAAWERGCSCPPDLPVCACGGHALFRRLERKGVRPTPEEVAVNPRARSAVLRAAERMVT